MPFALEIAHLTKRYRMHSSRPRTLFETLSAGLKGNDKEQCVVALEDVSFTVEQGAILGIIGHNGAGKSTLLRLLCGLSRPTSGRIRINGIASALLELGAGLHPDLSGRQNIMTIGILNGLPRAEVLARQDAIVGFAELEDFIDQPVRTYSSGMYLRLAFAAAMEFDPAILIIDEVLTVGDERFQQKCLERIQTFRARGKTLIVTSHDAGLIQTLCDQVLVLEEGKFVMQADPKSAIACYHELMHKRTSRRASGFSSSAVLPGLLNSQGNRQGTQEASIISVDLLSHGKKIIEPLSAGQELTIKLTVDIGAVLPDVACTVGVFSETHVKCHETVIPSLKTAFGTAQSHFVLQCHIESLPLFPGTYYVNAGLFPTDWSFVYDFHWQIHGFQISSQERPSLGAAGVVSLKTVWTILPVSMK